jgi:hypothetical protein
MGVLFLRLCIAITNRLYSAIADLTAMATDNIETLLPQGQLRPDKRKGQLRLVQIFLCRPRVGLIQRP